MPLVIFVILNGKKVTFLPFNIILYLCFYFLLFISYVLVISIGWLGWDYCNLHVFYGWIIEPWTGSKMELAIRTQSSSLHPKLWMCFTDKQRTESLAVLRALPVSRRKVRGHQNPQHPSSADHEYPQQMPRNQDSSVQNMSLWTDGPTSSSSGLSKAEWKINGLVFCCKFKVSASLFSWWTKVNANDGCLEGWKNTFENHQ